MKKIFLICIVFLAFYAPEALADVAPEDEKTGCSTVGAFDLGYILLPVLLLGLLTFFQKPKKAKE